MQKKESRKDRKFAAVLIRIAPDLKAGLVDLAEREHRSLNQQIEFMLAEALRLSKSSGR
jgi:hypothetical protein